jgi:hypothetical protein
MLKGPSLIPSRDKAEHRMQLSGEFVLQKYI